MRDFNNNITQEQLIDRQRNERHKKLLFGMRDQIEVQRKEYHDNKHQYNLDRKQPTKNSMGPELTEDQEHFLNNVFRMKQKKLRGDLMDQIEEKALLQKTQDQIEKEGEL